MTTVKTVEITPLKDFAGRPEPKKYQTFQKGVSAFVPVRFAQIHVDAKLAVYTEVADTEEEEFDLSELEGKDEAKKELSEAEATAKEIEDLSKLEVSALRKLAVEKYGFAKKEVKEKSVLWLIENISEKLGVKL